MSIMSEYIIVAIVEDVVGCQMNLEPHWKTLLLLLLV
jgi:hypothetical protein